MNDGGPKAPGLSWLSSGLAVGAAIGGVVATVRSRAGFSYALGLGFDSAVGDLLFWSGVGLLTGGLAWGVRAGLASLGRVRGSGPLASLLAVCPGLAWGGYELNRWLGIHPRQLLSSHALSPNLGIIGAALGAAILLTVLVGRRWGGSGRPLAVAGLVGLLLAGSHAWLFRDGQEKSRPDVLILLIDALRADHVGVYGHARDTTPHLDRLAADGVRFAETVASSTFTKTSIASLFTGRHPYQHGVYWGAWTDADGRVQADLLTERETTLAEHFRERGYLTEAWVQNGHLRRAFGFAQGFVHYRDQQGHSPRINRLFRRFLQRAGQRYPYLAYLHYIDLHDPYQPPNSFRDRFGDPGAPYEGIDLTRWGSYLEAVRGGSERPTEEQLRGWELLYDAQLAAVDAEIGELLDALRAEGRYDETLIVVTSDHGDAFGEHGVISHSTAPYDELVLVPWIVKLPANRFAGKVIESQVALVDLLPTVADAVGLAGGVGAAGCSRWPEIRGGERDGDDCALAISEIAEVEGQEATIGLRRHQRKYIRSHGGREQLFDLALDPEERIDRADDPVFQSELEELRHLAFEILAARQRGAQRIDVDPATLEQLKALGYIGGIDDPNDP